MKSHLHTDDDNLHHGSVLGLLGRHIPVSEALKCRRKMCILESRYSAHRGKRNIKKNYVPQQKVLAGAKRMKKHKTDNNHTQQFLCSRVLVRDPETCMPHEAPRVKPTTSNED